VLVLGRKSGESIRLGDEIVITVMEVEKGRVRIGIDAPARVTVHREEVYERVAEANRRAASEVPADVLDRLHSFVAEDATKRGECT